VEGSKTTLEEEASLRKMYISKRKNLGLQKAHQE
jgi:hypothetical protein